MSGISSNGFGEVTQDGSSFRMSTNPLGIDSGKMIEQMVEFKSRPIELIKDRIDVNKEKIEKLGELKTKFETYRDASAVLSNPSLRSGNINVFEKKLAFLSSASTIGAGSLLGISTTQSTAKGSHTLRINQIASHDNINSSVTFTAGTDTPITVNGDIVIPKDDGSGNQTIAVETTDTVNDIIAKINNYTNSTNVKASIVKLTDAQYKINLQYTTTGKAVDLTASDAQVNIDIGFTAAATNTDTLRADLIFNGNQVYRTTNTVTDLIEGATLDLVQADNANDIKIEIESDLGTVKSAILDWVDAHNDFIDFYNDETKVELGANAEIVEKGVLNHVFAADNSRSRIMSALSAAIVGLGNSTYNNIADIGLEINKGGNGISGKITVDDDVLNARITENVDQVRDLFGLNFETSSTQFKVIGRPEEVHSGLLGTAVTFRVTATDGSGVPTAAEYEATIPGVGLVTEAATITTVSGDTFVDGNSASEYFSGFSLTYSGPVAPPNFEETFTPTRGIADAINRVIMTEILAPNEQNGLIEKDIELLNKLNTLNEDKKERMERLVEGYKNRLILQFKNAEIMIQKFQAIQNQIKAQMAAMKAAAAA
jgi:flagellar hook-associated protein 2